MISVIRVQAVAVGMHQSVGGIDLSGAVLRSHGWAVPSLLDATPPPVEVGRRPLGGGGGGGFWGGGASRRGGLL